MDKIEIHAGMRGITHMLQLFTHFSKMDKLDYMCNNEGGGEGE